jgi:hypothetical protein
MRWIIEWLTNMVYSLTWRGVLFGTALFVITFTLNLAVVSFVLVKLPAAYFHESYSRAMWEDRHHLVRWSGMILKNLVGVVMVALGIVMSLPGVPGQGLLTILLGLIMLDIPGKRPIEARLIRRPQVLNAINRLRAKFDKPPLVIE